MWRNAPARVQDSSIIRCRSCGGWMLRVRFCTTCGWFVGRSRTG